MGVGVEEDGCFHSSVVDLLWELQLSWVTHLSSDGCFCPRRSVIYCGGRTWLLQPPLRIWLAPHLGISSLPLGAGAGDEGGDGMGEGKDVRD